MQIPTRKEIGRFSHGYMTGLAASSVITLIEAIVVEMGGPSFMLYFVPIVLASGAIMTYIMALLDKEDIPREIAMYAGKEGSDVK